jgi:Ankyrin repeats (3 copies)
MKVIDQYPLARYAVEHWWQPAQNLDKVDGGTVFKLASRPFAIERDILLSWIQLYNFDEPWRDLDISLRPNDIAQPLYYAASARLPEVVENVLSQTTNVNAQRGHYGNALQVASYGGHEKVVQMLLEAKADVNAQGGEYGNTL